MIICINLRLEPKKLCSQDPKFFKTWVFVFGSQVIVFCFMDGHTKFNTKSCGGNTDTSLRIRVLIGNEKTSNAVVSENTNPNSFNGGRLVYSDEVRSSYHNGIYISV